MNPYVVEVETSTHDALRSGVLALPRHRGGPVFTTVAISTARCAWHAVMAVAENWYTSQVEDPTAAWCQGDPSVFSLVESARDLISGYCHCAD